MATETDHEVQAVGADTDEIVVASHDDGRVGPASVLVAPVVAATGVALMLVDRPWLLVPAAAIVFFLVRALALTVASQTEARVRPRGGNVVDLVALEGGEPGRDRPMRRRRVRPVDVFEMLTAAAAGFAFALLIRVVFDHKSTMEVAIWSFIGGLVALYLLARDRAGVPAAIDRVVTTLVWTVGLLVASALGWLLVFVFSKGLSKLSWSFFTEDLSKVGPLSPGGGAKHAIIGTLEQVGVATILVVPVAMLTAVYLNEVQGVLARPVRFVVDAMSGLPSIVAGLLVFTVWVDGHGFSGGAGAVALFILMIPTVTRTSEEMLRTVNDTLREGALALGAPRWQVARRVVVPTAAAGLVTAVLLGIARAVGETAPMLLTSFGADTTNTSLRNGPQSDLPLFVWKLLRVPNATQNARAWTGMVVLVLLILVLFTTARYVLARSQKKLGRAV